MSQGTRQQATATGNRRPLSMIGMGKAGFNFRLALLALYVVPICGGSVPGQTLGTASGPWVMERSGTTAGLRGIHAVGGGVAWASGTNGTVLRTEDGGYQWQSCAMPPGAEKLDFRGIWAWDANTAIVMSSGPGDQSRLYKTTDGCSSWKLLFTNPDKDGFWDAVAFRDRIVGWLLGDPVRGQFQLWHTSTGGDKWSPEADSRVLKAKSSSEGAFAASNSSLLVDRSGWGAAFGSGGIGGAFFFRIEGESICVDCDVAPKDLWAKTITPVASGSSSAGIFSIADWGQIVAVGGDYTKPNESAGTAAWSADGGKTWTAAVKSPHGYRSAVAWDAQATAWITVGTN